MAKMLARCVFVFKHKQGAQLPESAETLGQHPTGIITPICPEIYSFSFSAGVCQRWMEIFAAPIPFGSQSCSREAFIFYFLLFTVKTNLSAWEKKVTAYPTSSLFYYISWYYLSNKAKPEMCFRVPVSLIVIFCFIGRFVGLWSFCFVFYVFFFVLSVFTFIVFDIHRCLGLQQQRDQFLVTTQGSMVHRRQPLTHTDMDYLWKIHTCRLC